MEIQIFLSDERQSVWLERIKREITRVQSELDKRMPTFIEQEKDYLNEKAKIDELKAIISKENEEMRNIVHAQNFPVGVILKPHLTRSGEPVQQQVVKQKKGYDKNGLKPLKSIKWQPLAEPVLLAHGKFMRVRELFNKLDIDQTEVNYRRFTVTCSDYSTWFKVHKVGHHAWVGLKDWFDEEGVPNAAHLADFLQTKTA